MGTQLFEDITSITENQLENEVEHDIGCCPPTFGGVLGWFQETDRVKTVSFPPSQPQ